VAGLRAGATEFGKKVSAMRPRERFLRTVRGEAADRVPLWLGGFHVPSRADLQRVSDPRRREIAERIFEQVHATWSVASHVNRYLVTPSQRIRLIETRETPEGTVRTRRIDSPKGPLTAVTVRNALTDTVWTLKYPCETREDIEKIRSIPWERPEGLAPPDGLRRSHDPEGRRVVTTSISSPFVCVAGMMRYEWFLELCHTDLPLLRDLTAICEARLLDVLDVLLDSGEIEYVWIGGCEWVTPPMASPRVYEALVQGPESRVIARIHRAGALAHVHCHGNVRSSLEWVVARGADLFEPVEPPPDGDLTFFEAKRLVAGRMTLAGNVEARVLEYGSETDVEEAVRAAFEGGKERMVLSTTAGPCRRMDDRVLRNYHRFVDAWEELSPL